MNRIRVVSSRYYLSGPVYEWRIVIAKEARQ